MPEKFGVTANQNEYPELQILETEKRLSQCMLWKHMQRYYQEEGMNAWQQVPAYITNNRIIAEAYADMVVAAMLDTLPILNFDEPFYILELGSGTGQFATYFLQELTAKLAYYDMLETLNWRYVMTDFTPDCFLSWAADPQLANFLAQGRLDMALFRPEDDQTLFLQKHQINLTVGSIKNPVIAIANYFFDSIAQDLFFVNQGALSEILVNFFRALDGITKADTVKLSHLKNFDTMRLIADEYYPDPVLNQILAFYKEHLTSAPFIFPIGAFNVLRNLQALSSQNLILLSSDKGFTTLEYIQNNGCLKYAPHGEAFSFPVNYHAIAEYFEIQGGCSFATQNSVLASTVNVISAHTHLAWKHLNRVFKNRIARQNPILNHYYILELLTENPGLGSHDVLAGCQAIMEYFLYEPRTLHACYTRLESIIPTLNESQQKQLITMLGEIEEHVLALYQEQDHWLALGKLYFHLKAYDRCQINLEKSEAFYGVTEESCQYQIQLYRVLSPEIFSQPEPQLPDYSVLDLQKLLLFLTFARQESGNSGQEKQIG